MKASKESRRNAKQLFELCKVNGVFDQERALSLTKRIIDAKPRGYLQTLAHFERLVKLDIARRAASVESVISLTPQFSGDIRDYLIRAYGPGLDLSFTVDPDLIGGMRITVGFDVYDGTMRGRLNALAKRL